MSATVIDRRPGWRLFRITLVAVALYVGFRVLPTGTNLNHMDFQVQGENTLQMCDPANPQFLPVVNVRSPVSMTLVPVAPLVAGQEVEVVLSLATSSGKAISPIDLLRVHTELLHLMIIDPQMMDYHHVHPRPLAELGKWSFRFTPRYGGDYRFFGDFTPQATGLGLYANADLVVSGDAPTPDAITKAHLPSWQSDVAGYRFTLTPTSTPVRAGKEAEFTLRIINLNGGNVPLETIMGAYAHVVAFDQARTGFAHLHPQQTDLTVPPDPVAPTLTFKVSIPQSGPYVLWAQVQMDGTERFAPFWFKVN